MAADITRAAAGAGLFGVGWIGRKDKSERERWRNRDRQKGGSSKIKGETGLGETVNKEGDKDRQRAETDQC